MYSTIVLCGSKVAFCDNNPALESSQRLFSWEPYFATWSHHHMVFRDHRQIWHFAPNEMNSLTVWADGFANENIMQVLSRYQLLSVKLCEYARSMILYATHITRAGFDCHQLNDRASKNIQMSANDRKYEDMNFRNILKVINESCFPFNMQDSTLENISVY